MEELNPLFGRRLITGDRLMLAHVYLEPGCVVPKHAHENEQMTYVLEGSMRFWIGEDEAEVVELARARCCTSRRGCRTRPRRSSGRSTSTSSRRRGRTGSTDRTRTCAREVTDHRSTAARCARTCAACRMRSAAPSCGRSSRPTATATAPTTVAAVALEEGARMLCVATVGRGRRRCGRRFRTRGSSCSGPPPSRRVPPRAREARLELVVADGPLPEGDPAPREGRHRDGPLGARRAPSRRAPDVVGLMSHLASADTDPAFTELQIARFAAIAAQHPGLTRHLANSAGILRYPAAHFDAGRPGIALYGLSPFGTDPADDGLRPVLSWRSDSAQVKRLEPGESTGYHRRFVASEPTWIGIVPVGYADGFRRALTGCEVLVGGERCPVVGIVSMDAFAVRLRRPVEPGTPVTLIGDGLARRGARGARSGRSPTSSCAESTPSPARAGASADREGDASRPPRPEPSRARPASRRRGGGLRRIGEGDGPCSSSR